MALAMDYTTPPPDLPALRAMWDWLRPPGCRLTLAEALRHPTYSIVIKCAVRGNRQQRRRESARERITPATEPDLFSDTPVTE